MSEDTTNSWCPELPETPTPQDRRQTVNPVAGSVCHVGWRPLMLTGMLRELMIRHFASPDQIEEPDLRRAVWQNTPATGILIESVFRFKPDTLEKRPAILIKRNTYRNMRVLLNDRVGTDGQGNEDFTTFWVGSHTLFCLHGTGASTEILATEVQRELTQFAPAVRKTLRLHRYQVMEVGEISEIEEATQNYAVAIDVAWAYEESWKLIEEELPLATIDRVLDLG